MLSLTDLFTPQTKDEVETSMLAVAASLGLPTTSWQAGGVGRTIIAVVAQTVANFTQVIAVITAGGYLDYATDGWLTLLAYHSFGVERRAAAAGTTPETLTNATGGDLGPYAAGDLRFANGATGKTYTNLAAVTVPASGSVDVVVQADEVGTDSNAAPGEISVLLTSVIGLTCTNAASLVGTDEETDAALRVRARAKLGALSPNGARAAYEYVALSAGATVNRVKVTTDTATGTVYTTVAQPAGALTIGELATVDDAIQSTCVPCAVTAVTQNVSEVVVPVTSTVSIYAASGLTAAQLQAKVAEALTSYLPEVPIGGDDGGKIYRAKLIETIAGVSPYIYNVVLAAPASDATVAGTQVATLGTVTTTVVVS